MVFSQQAFRECLGCFTTGVTIVTCFTEGKRYGVTVNSFNSVSLDPPLILFSLDNNASSTASFFHANHFVVNILSEQQMALSEIFSQPKEVNGNKWHDVTFTDSTHQQPLLEGSLATIECSLETTYPGGDHTIFIGRVEHFTKHSDVKPLLYYSGQYSKL